jgi:hypothetical protein
LAVAIAWKAAWCSRTPSTRTHSSTFAYVLLLRSLQPSADGFADADGATPTTAEAQTSAAAKSDLLIMMNSPGSFEPAVWANVLQSWRWLEGLFHHVGRC